MSFLYILDDVFGLNGSASSLVGIVAESFFVYCWHRFVLLDRADMRGESWMPFLKRTLLYYVGLTLLLVSGFLILTGMLQALSETLAALVALSAPIGVFLILPRIALVFPALAVESNNSKMKDALDLSRGQVWPLAGAYFLIGLCTLVLMIPAFLIGVVAGTMVAEPSGFSVFNVILNLVAGLSAAIIAVLIAGLNSSLYRQLGGDIPGQSNE